VEDIKPAVDRIRNKSGDINENAVVANVQYQVEILKETSSILSQLIRDGKLKIVGGSYNLDNGQVDMLA
jgi:carbonic anhydrase